jgi:hypothetical protein
MAHQVFHLDTPQKEGETSRACALTVGFHPVDVAFAGTPGLNLVPLALGFSDAKALLKVCMGLHSSVSEGVKLRYKSF